LPQALSEILFNTTPSPIIAIKMMDSSPEIQDQDDLITSMEWLGLPGAAFNHDIGRPYRVLTWEELHSGLKAPELDRKKLSILSFYVCHDRTRNCREETKQDLFDRDTASWMEYFRERLQRAPQEFTSDFAQLLVPLVTLMLQFCGAPIPRDSIPPLDYYDPNWTLGDAMAYLSQALGYPSQTLEPPATFKPNEMAILAANSKIFGEAEAPDANEMIKEFIRSAPFGVPLRIEVCR
jgi:hypothetical protein